MTTRLDLIATKADNLGFKFTVLGGSKNRLVFPGTGLGYQGSLEGCMAYLQGWEERYKRDSELGG